jgi:hypothetical protein
VHFKFTSAQERRKNPPITQVYARNFPRINTSRIFRESRISLIPLDFNSTRINTSGAKDLKSPGINTSGNKDLKSFRINTSENTVWGRDARASHAFYCGFPIRETAIPTPNIPSMLESRPFALVLKKAFAPRPRTAGGNLPC